MFELQVASMNPDIEKVLAYAVERRFPRLQGVRVDHGDAGKSTLVIEELQNQNVEEIRKFTEEVCLHAGSLAGRVESRVLWNNNEADLSPMSLSYLEQKNVVCATDLPGVFLLNQDLVQWKEVLDRLCCAFAESEGARTVSIPTLLTRQHLEQAGYWEREEQQISEVLPRVGEKKPNCCLSPAACLPLYPLLSGKDQAPSPAVTSRCSVYRWEGGVFPESDPLSRLWEYEVRELVFFGNQESLKAVKERYVNFCRWMADGLGLSASMQVASDAFFHAESVKIAVYQLISQNKLEFRTHFSTGGLAVSSFNAHQRHFVEAFDIHSSDAGLQSACIGFGLDRLAYSCLAAAHQGKITNLALAESLAKQALSAPWE